ncbi:MAG TPA: hypothetical protein VFA94_06425 [Acidimicrobiales bacterium]|nr:hypothetical protein [Acidimicrobiales bacterium]
MLVALVAAVAAPTEVAAQTSPPDAADQTSGGKLTAKSAGSLSDFNAGSSAGVVDFRFSYPNLVLPYVVSGGILEASTLAAGTGRAQGIAGPMPIPILTSGQALVPTNDPITGTPVPQEIQDAMKSINFAGFPNYCQSDYPAPQPGSDVGNCGGPNFDDPKMGGTAAGVNGYTQSTGDGDKPLQSKATATSRAAEMTVPGLQLAVHNAWSSSTSGLNEQGAAQGHGQTEIGSVSLLSGAVRFNDIRSEAIAATDGVEPAAVTSFTMKEAYVVGIPVIVSADGVSVNQQAVPGTSVRTLADQLSAALKANDLQIRLVPATPPNTVGGEVTATSAGVEVVHQGTSVTPTDSVYRFGFTSARADASTGDSGDLTSGGDTSSTGNTSTASTDSSTGSTDTGSSGSSFDLSSTAGPELAAPSVTPAAPTPAARTTATPRAGFAASAGSRLGNLGLITPASALPVKKVRSAFLGGFFLVLLSMAAFPLRRVIAFGLR